MKKFVLELTKGSQHLGSWYVGDEPLHMRIIDEDEVVLELALRVPKIVKGQSRFEKQEGDDFTMPFPVGEEVSSLGYDLSQQIPIAEPPKEKTEESDSIIISEPELLSEDVELSFEMSSSIMFGQDFDESDFVDEEPVIDFEALVESELDQSIEFVAPSPDVLDALRESINGIDIICANNEDDFEHPPSIPEVVGDEEMDIAVWKQVGGDWTCIERLQANAEYSFYGVSIWVDNNAALLLTGSDDMLILVQEQDSQEKEYRGINGSLPLPSRAIVLLQKGADSICFRPE
ncbi:MAG: hypothetical protein CL916_13405 [Deltaproteobacteria bacterium]|nr:hypothetical protein [Deltaproteobacteria bacterium]